MELRALHPGDLLTHPETGIQELMRIFLMRTNFVPGIRHVMGWRGLKDSSQDVVGWTAKIKYFPGIYGIYFATCQIFGRWITGKFALCYFLDPDEELVEACSVEAVAVTQRNDYFTRVRDFLRYPDLCSLFAVARIDLCANGSEDALLVGMESVSRQRTVARDGIYGIRDGRHIEIVAPGGYDLNFPSYSISLAFFRVYAASVTFNLNEPPVYLLQAHRKGEEIVYTSKGKVRERESDSIQNRCLYLGYGEAPDKIADKLIISGDAPDTVDISWKKGDEPVSEYDDELWWDVHTVTDYKTLDKRILGIEERPQLIMVTGFLGSGKTTFIQNFIEYHVQHNRFVAVIQNEIGEIGLDGKLLDNDYAVMEIDEGCVCCSLVGSIKRAIRQILSQFHPDFIIIETTGLANPFNLLDEIGEIKELVRFDGVTTFVDASNIEESMESFKIASQQVKAADILVINKTDLVDEETLMRVKTLLREKNSIAPLVAVEQGDINPTLLYGINFEEMAEKIQGHTASPSAIDKSTHIHDGLESVKIALPETINKETFLSLIESLPTFVFRAKGVVRFENYPNPCIVQYVNGRYDLAECSNKRFHDRFLVFIGKGIKEESFKNFIT